MQRVAWLMVGLLSGPAGDAADRHFVLHPIDPQSTNNSGAAIDVNRDGRLDVVAGPYWYAAPDWHRHDVRDVEVIRGRPDDYSSLPLDVNGDGRLDLVSANYRSGKLYWIEQPADPQARWTTHVIAEPGPMETARLVDLNADGRLDVLPNGRNWAAWWTQTPKGWERRELPAELAGHGIGAGDINGDGRIDVVGPNGWAESPADPSQPWTFHADWSLHRDCCVPMLVFDVDGDGDNDLVWSRAHGTGLYWLEQQAGATGRTWTKHVIDTAWSQAHTLELADLDGNGRPNIVTGKRYLAHEGRDIGEWDPLLIASYEFLPDSRSWKREVLNTGTACGWDLDPKVVDLDGDGDLDLLCPGRSGLFWLEQRPGKAAVPNEPFRDDLGVPAIRYADQKSLLMWQPTAGDLRPIVEPWQWGVRRSHARTGMQLAMGPLPDPSRRVPLHEQVVREEAGDGYARQRIQFTSEPGDTVPAWLLIPPEARNAAGAKLPAMLCLHQTTGIGKNEPAGLGGLPNLQYAHELAQRGYVCIVPDYPSFGEYPYDFKTQGAHYASGSMKAIWNNLRAVDVLETLSYVDPDRIGAIGHSLGGHNALFTATFDLRLKAVVTSCGFTPFHDYYGGKVAGWTSDRYMPRIREVYGNNADQVPFDFYAILGGLAPRACFSSSPIADDNFDVGGVRKAFAEARKVYDLLQVPPDRLRLETPNVGHDFPPDVRKQAYEWLDAQLR
jgi:dienelactone hydrolase